MKFAKGIVLGSLVTAGVLTMYLEGDTIMKITPKKMIKKGKRLIKKIGIM